MSLVTGTRLGRYEIRSKIGEGGMGEVYRSSDPKIGRDVAIKTLPADFSADKDRVARFELEALCFKLRFPAITVLIDTTSRPTASGSWSTNPLSPTRNRRLSSP